jgi:phosphoserine aminotransferase
MARAYNFSAGPACLPTEVLEEAQATLLDYQGAGASIMEMSHRGKEYSAVHEEAIANVRELMGISDDYAVLFMQGGASTQFALVPMNLLGEGQTADYTDSGAWAAKAIKEARLIGNVNVIADCGKEIPTRVPSLDELSHTAGAAYLHITSNETISGAQWKAFPKTDAPLVADMSSDILSRPLDVSDFGLIYAGLQKNLGPSGAALVVIRKDLADRVPAATPTMFKYATHIEKDSLFNTPPCFTIYLLMLVTRWLKMQGLENIHAQNVAKAAKLYEAIDASDFYSGTAVPECRSDMNVTWRLPSEELEATFVAEASDAGLKALKGHRSVGGIRASIYNACPPEGVDALIAFMKDFEAKHG